MSPTISQNNSPSYIGRIAPSPTGAQHLGNARTYLLAWLLAQRHQGKLLLRIEDLDTPRTKSGASTLILEDLRWLGLTWDADLSLPSPTECAYVIQSQRTTRYAEVLNHLKALELVYPCTCTRSEIEQSASAPHEDSNSFPPPLDGTVYPGTCSERKVEDARWLDAQGATYAWRFRFPKEELFAWHDDFAGLQTLIPSRQLGDFVIARSYGPLAYQLAVVVDDHDSGINHVVRGDDLIYSTYRQLALYRAIGWEPPRWFHVPLVVGPDGKRLAKRHGDTRLVTLREQGFDVKRLIGILAVSLGLLERFREMDALELKDIVLADPEAWNRIPRHAVEIWEHRGTE